MKTRVTLVTLIVTLALLMLSASLVLASGPNPGDPQAARVSSWSQVYTIYTENNITTTTTRYSSSPKTISGIDASNFLQSGGAYNSADVFVSADISGTATIYITPQLSIDAVNWTNADYSYVTFNQTGTATLNSSTYALSLSADGTDYVRLPLAGRYLRFKIDVPAATANNSVTPTIKLVYKNN